MNKPVAIIQARLGSTRLPGKVMMDIAGKPMLWHVIRRLQHCRRVNVIMVATTTQDEDRQIIALARSLGADAWAGSSEDVLDRYYRAAWAAYADPVIRITADCPLIDPEIVDEVIESYSSHPCDILSLAGGFPDGLDVSVFSFGALERAWNNARLPSEREHVVPWMDKHLRHLAYERFTDLGHLRWTVDEPRDLEFVRAVYARLYNERDLFLTRDVLALLEREPDLLKINAGITRNAGYLKSLERDTG